jgi:murein DD-endopeptidase MepM/ murein hydrolase activator NlpD
VNHDDEALLVIGGLLLLAGAAVNAPIPWGQGWAWPVPGLITPDGARYLADVSQEFKPGVHAGVDVMFRRRTLMDRPEYKAHTVDGSAYYFAPAGVPILAAKDGVVWSAGSSPRGYSVVVDHGKPFATFYQHLDKLAVKKGDKVKAGTLLGTMGFDPLDASKLRHLHFAVWFEGAGDGHSVDPRDAMRTWLRPQAWSV